MAATLGLGGGFATRGAVIEPPHEPARNPYGKSSGGSHKPPPRHTRAKAWKRAFKGIACPHLKTTQFYFD